MAAFPKDRPSTGTGAGSGAGGATEFDATGVAPAWEAPPWAWLPLPLTPLVGREAELAAAAALLADPAVRLLTLVGAGGSGKTRLAVEIALVAAGDARPGAAAGGARADEGFAFVPLAPIREPGLVLPTIAQAVGLREVGSAPLREGLVAALRARRFLLVLDNFEQVAGAAAAVADLLVTCPTLRVVVTSRSPLRVSGEHLVPVPPLALPAPPGGGGEAAGAPEELLRFGAVALFVQRARQIRPDFALTAENAPLVIEICRRLDGLPLAIELATSRLRHLTPAALLARLEQRLPLLTGGARDLPARQRTLRDAIAWSYDLLLPAEQALFRRLAVFAGGFTLDGAEYVGRWSVDGGSGRMAPHSSDLRPPTSDLDVLDGVTRLIDVGLVVPMGEVEGEPRFGMLATIREFGLERLAAAGDEEGARAAHAAAYLAVAEEAGRGLFGADEVRWLRRLEAEHDNLRAALAWATADPARRETALRFAGALWWFWETRGHLTEGQAWLERALAGSEGMRTAARAAVLAGTAWLVELRGEHARARALAEEALAIGREIGDPATEARALFMRSFAVGGEGDHAAAEGYAAESLSLYRRLGDEAWIPFALNRLGIEVHARGEIDRAAALYGEALGRWRAVGQPWGIGTVLLNLGLVARERGEHERAAALYRECLPLAVEQGDRWGLIELLLGLAEIAVAKGQAALGVRLAAAADAAREVGGIILQPYVRRAAERTLQLARTALGGEGFAAAWEAGRALSLEEAVEQARRVGMTDAPAAEPAATVPPPAGAGARRRPPAPTVGGLTARELEVLRFVAEGRSDREIGEALFVSPRTVGAHVASIYGKLGINSRAAAAAFAVRHGLTGERS